MYWIVSGARGISRREEGGEKWREEGDDASDRQRHLRAIPTATQSGDNLPQKAKPTLPMTRFNSSATNSTSSAHAAPSVCHRSS